MNAKAIAIVSHITIIGWVIAFVVNMNNKEEFASFYIRQTLGIFLLGIVLSWIPVLNIVAWVVTLIFWLMSLISAIQGEMKETPLVGGWFQDWFRSF
jgi:uncharacterized membrane protein